MATRTKTDAEYLVEFDREMAELRATLDPGDLTNFDLETAPAPDPWSMPVPKKRGMP